MIATVAFWFAACQVLYGLHVVNDEVCRKIGHVAGGCSIALWLPHLTRAAALVFATAYVLATLAARVLRMHSFHLADPRRLGDLAFALALALLATIPVSIRVSVLAILMVALADAAAALIGNYFPVYRYRVWGAERSVSGTVAFFVVAIVLLIVWDMTVSGQLQMASVLAFAAGCTLVENSLPFGLDNLGLPVAVIVLSGLWIPAG